MRYRQAQKMNNVEWKSQASLFRKKYGLRTINSETLCKALKEQGYTVVEFNGISDKPAVAELIDALQIRNLASQSRCFTYQDENYRLVFLHEDLNDEERTITLAHEEGHIWNRHMNQGNVIGTDVIQEFEANEFAHYLLLTRSDSHNRKLRVCVFTLLLLVLCAVVAITIKHYHDKAIFTDNLYRVSDGKKYHFRDCNYIKDRKDVTRLTIDEYESGEYEPCSVCKPDEYIGKSN